MRYQLYHVFALALAGILHQYFPNSRVRVAGGLFIAGMILFCGSLYILTYSIATDASGLSWAGPVTPVGGLLFIVGWISLAAGMNKSGKY